MTSQHICVIGLGYIGLPTAALLAKHGFSITGVDLDHDKLSKVARGENILSEKGLNELIQMALADNRLTVSSYPVEADIYIICVPTPIREQKGESKGVLPEPDMSHVHDAVSKVATTAPNGALVILESTSPVGSTAMMADQFKNAGRDPNSFSFAYCPERVLPGNIIWELEENDRIVGGLNQHATERACAFYQRFVSGKIWPCKAEMAELCKLVENSYRDVNIAFANELSMICHQLGVDVRELIHLANQHPRVSILDAGIGVGGHCIAIDPWFIASAFPDHTPLIQTGRKVNDYKTKWVTKRIHEEAEALKELLGRSPKIALLGLTYKSNVSDLRESPACRIAHKLSRLYPDTVCVEPHVDNNLEGLNFDTIENVGKNSDLIIALVRHDAFAQLDQHLKESTMFIDFCGLISD